MVLAGPTACRKMEQKRVDLLLVRLLLVPDLLPLLLPSGLWLDLAAAVWAAVWSTREEAQAAVEEVECMHGLTNAG